MSRFGERFRNYIQTSKEVKMRIGSFTVTRFGILCFGLVLLVAIVLIPIVIALGNRTKGLTYALADVVPGYSYRMKNDRISYRTEDRVYTYDCVNDVSAYYPLGLIEGYDSSDTMTVVYYGSQFQIQGNKEAMSLSAGTIIGVRAGKNYAALLYRIPSADRDERFIQVIDREMHAVNRISFKDSDVVAFDFLDAGTTELLWVSTMDVGQFTEESIVRIYDCGKDVTMIHYTAPFYNQAIYNLYLSDRCLFMVGTQSIIRYDREDDGFSAERDRIRVYGSTVVDFYSAGESAYFIALPVAAEGEENSLVRLITVSQSDDLWSNVMQKYMPSPVVGAFLFNQSICVFTHEFFLQYGFSGKQLADIELSDVPTAVFRYGDDGFFLVTDQTCRRVTLS